MVLVSNCSLYQETLILSYLEPDQEITVDTHIVVIPNLSRFLFEPIEFSLKIANAVKQIELFLFELYLALQLCPTKLGKLSRSRLKDKDQD